MVFFTVQFLIHSLCALNFCVPQQSEPKTEPLYENSIGFRSGIDDELDPLKPPTIDAPFGGLRGTIMKSIKGRPIAAFFAVPYAKPPIGERRFQPPEPIGKWDGVRIADKAGSICLQLDPGQYFRVDGHEDCLHLNIYTPKLPKENAKPKLPVIVFLHGGGFLFGSGNYEGPSYFLDHDVIFVTVNYRLGILGFLSTGDEVAPGNNGLKDQAMALRWVKDNIEHFGGDPDQITLMGQSAGAVSSNLHLISKQSRDIPVRAILHSGNALVHWATINGTAESSRRVAASFACPTTSSSEMVECLRKQNPYLVVSNQKSAHRALIFPMIPFGPVVEAPGPNAFLEVSPTEAYARGLVKNVPVINGIVSDEGDLFAFAIWLWPGLMSALNRQWHKLAPQMLDFTDDDGPTEVATKVKRFYLEDKALSFYNRKSFSTILGDRIINNGVYKGLKTHSQIAPTYGYYFNYRGRFSVSTTVGLNKEDWGVTHLDDLLYLVNSTFYYPGLQVSDEEFGISEFMTNVWMNFVITGTPTFTNDEGEDVEFWRKVTDPSKIEVLEINKKPGMVPFPEKIRKRVEFWESLNLKPIMPEMQKHDNNKL